MAIGPVAQCDGGALVATGGEGEPCGGVGGGEEGGGGDAERNGARAMSSAVPSLRLCSARVGRAGAGPGVGCRCEGDRRSRVGYGADGNSKGWPCVLRVRGGSTADFGGTRRVRFRVILS